MSKTDRKISQIVKKEQENKFIDSMRSMMTSLTQSINKISEIDRKILQTVVRDQIISSWIAWDLLWLHCHCLLIKYQRLIKKNHANW